jgi:hypothetical protein
VPAPQQIAMTLIAQSQPRCPRGYRPRKRSAVWRFLKRYQLVELFLIVGGICLAWLGVMLGSGQL